jgi:RNA polymerase sigma factor (sigma-70 family)
VSEIGTRTNIELLERTQEYLRCAFEQLAPDSLLTAAWDEFYRVYNVVLRRFAISRGLRGSDIDDCLQEVWMEVARSLVDFERPLDRPGLRAWLYTVVRNKANGLFRRSARRRERTLEEAQAAGAEPQSPRSDPAALMQEQWERTLLETVREDVRGELSENNARLLQMRLVEQRDVADVAAELQLSPEQVWYRQYRLLKKLKARMAMFTGEPLGGGDDKIYDRPDVYGRSAHAC